MTPFPPRGSILSRLPPESYIKALIAYFASGWAFLIPYLTAYLIYAALKWPVNPTAASGLKLLPPCLLHVYWLLHAMHLVLGLVALYARWPKPAFFWSAIPWLCLGLLFWIPGVYLEFPADPWEHYARINEWSSLNIVSLHPSWIKSSYFLAYSLIGSISPPSNQLKWFDVYYAGSCLLLCWQYHKLARAVGLCERASFIFVLIQAITFGNSIFGFYRYYGMSSSLFGQLGAVALIRLALEAAAGRSKRQTAQFPPPWTFSPLVQSTSALLLVALTAFNHVQGIGAAALGVAAVAAWRAVEWRRSMIWWLPLGGVLTACAAYAWLPRHPLLDKIYQPAGWLNCWYGFNLLWPESPAFERAYMILGGFGLFSLTIALVLAVRTQVSGWMTIVPILALLHPAVAIPLCNFLAASGADSILIFHRLLFSIPVALPFVAFLAGYAGRVSTPDTKDDNRNTYSEFRNFTTAGLARHGIWGIPAACLLCLIVPSHGRLWHTLHRVPDDLAMRPILGAAHRFVSSKNASQGYLLLGSACMDFIYDTQDSQLSPFSPYAPPRIYQYPIARAPTDDLRVIERYLITHSKQRPLLILVPNPTTLFTTKSIAATLSQQWLPQEAALAFAGTTQILSVAEYHGLSSALRDQGVLFLTNASLVQKATGVR